MSQVGGALGLAILSTAATSRTSSLLSGPGHGTPYAHLSALVSGFQVAYVAAAVLLAIAALVMAAFLRSRDLEAIENPAPVMEPAA